MIDYNLSDLSLRSCLIHQSWWTSHPMASHGVPWRRVTEDHNFLLAFHGFLQINGARIHIAIRDQDQDASSLAHRPNGTLRVFQCHSISIHFNQSATNIIIIYIHITIYRYGIVAEGSETHHFRGRQNSPKEVPTCLMYPEMCLWPSYLSVTKKSRQLAAASHPDPASRWCFSKRRRTPSKPAWNTGAWMQGLPGLSTTEANMGLSKRCTLW